MEHLPKRFYSSMTLLRVLVVLFLALTNSHGTVILPGKPSVFYCLWSECRGQEWRNDWTPGITTGTCVNQQRIGHPLYESHKTPWVKRCPAPIACMLQTQHRKMCKKENALPSFPCCYSCNFWIIVLLIGVNYLVLKMSAQREIQGFTVANF